MQENARQATDKPVACRDMKGCLCPRAMEQTAGIEPATSGAKVPKRQTSSNAASAGTRAAERETAREFRKGRNHERRKKRLRLPSAMLASGASDGGRTHVPGLEDRCTASVRRLRLESLHLSITNYTTFHLICQYNQKCFSSK